MWRTKKPVLAALLLVFASLLIVVPAAPIRTVHATGPTLVQSKVITTCSGTSCSIGYTSPVTSGNLLILSFGVVDNGCNIEGLPNTPTDTLSNTWTKAIGVDVTYNTCGTSQYLHSYIYYTKTTSGGSDTVTVTFSQSVAGNLEVAEFGGTGWTIDKTSSGSCNSGSCPDAQSVTSFTPSASEFVYASATDYVGGSPSCTSSAGSGFTLDQSSLDGGTCMGTEYNSSLGSATTCPITTAISGGTTHYESAEVCIAVNPIPLVSVTLDLNAASGSTAISASNYFVVNYIAGGSLTSVHATSAATTFSADQGSAVTVSLLTSGSSSSHEWCVVSSAACSTVAFTAAASTFTYTYTELYQLALSGCNGPSLTPSPTVTSGDWYAAGTSLTVSCAGIWSRSGGTGTRAISSNWDGGSNTNVLTAATFSAQVTMSAAHTLNVNPTTQYFVTLDSGATSALGSCHPTITGDGCWYDSGATANIDLSGVYGRNTITETGSRLTSWELDSGSVNALLTATTFTISIGSIAAPHTIHTTSATQYYVTPGTGLTLSSPTISAGDAAWYDANSQVTVQGIYPVVYVVSSPLWANQVSSLGIQLVTNGTASTLTYGSLVLTFNCAKCAVQLFTPSASGLIVQTVTDDGKNVRFTTQGGVSTFSGSSAWTVYFGQTVVPVSTSTQTAVATSSTTQAGSGGIWQNLNSDPTWLETIAIAAAVLVITVLALHRRGHSFRKDLAKLEHIGGKD